MTGPAPPAGAPEDDAARLGNPSFVWRFGQERRLAMMERYGELDGLRVLDLGCGVGEYVRAFSRKGARAIGCDIAVDRLVEARKRDETGSANYLAGVGERLPFADASLDRIVLNEVIEHVQDDRQTMEEIARVLKPGGRCIIFAPNRLYPFETHGIYLRKRYIFGNIPLVNWLPMPLRNRLVPHARVYQHGDWKRLARGLPLRIVDRTCVYAGYDNIAARAPRTASFLRRVSYWAEANALRRFGLSHLVVYERTDR